MRRLRGGGRYFLFLKVDACRPRRLRRRGHAVDACSLCSLSLSSLRSLSSRGPHRLGARSSTLILAPHGRSLLPSSSEMSLPSSVVRSKRRLRGGGRYFLFLKVDACRPRRLRRRGHAVDACSLCSLSLSSLRSLSSRGPHRLGARSSTLILAPHGRSQSLPLATR